MTSDGEEAVMLTSASSTAFGIVLALLSAAVLALGGSLQSLGVHSAPTSPGSASLARSAERLLRSRPWILGTGLTVVAIVLQTGSLVFAPLIVVQPLGIAALVFSAVITAAVTRTAPARREVVAILISVVGVGAFVAVAAGVSHQQPITSGQLVTILVILFCVLLVAGGLQAVRRKGPSPIVFVVLGGVFSGFVATLGKTVILRIQAVFVGPAQPFGTNDVLTLLCVVGIAIAGALSLYFVQRAHATNPPVVVLAGLTVIDPAVGIILGIAVLHETAGAPVWAYAAFVASGAIAFSGVLSLSRQREQPVPAGSTGG
ncbi:multidrug DMT transporter permease [Leifsonia aquatica]|uniref:multidrug DMT transporter permease n=1 Tax=Leifsonia aquatica TaxID=144185 RepID=UPI0028B0D7C1|nr:multidrug DMT transporter permease [Leifsonia aquatica]